MNLIAERIQQADCKFGFILDGMPRTLAQASAIDDILAKQNEFVSQVLELDVPNEVLEARYAAAARCRRLVACACACTGASTGVGVGVTRKS